MSDSRAMFPGAYLGEFPVYIKTHPEYSQYNASSWAMMFISMYGQIDGAHHKAWVLDQVSRILLGTPVIVMEARWESGHTELRFHTGEPSESYQNWVLSMLGNDQGIDYEFEYDEGIAP